MFDNIGEKIKVLAQVVCWVGIVACCVGGVGLMFIGDVMVYIGLGVAVIGSFFSWIGSLALYGFGELIENTAYLRKEICGPNTSHGGNYTVASGEHSSPVGHLSGIQPLSKPSKPTNPGEWKCPKCQRIHKNYETSCLCGYNKNRPQG